MPGMNLVGACVSLPMCFVIYVVCLLGLCVFCVCVGKGDIYSRRLLASLLCIAVVGIAIALQRDGHCVAQWDSAPSM